MKLNLQPRHALVVLRGMRKPALALGVVGHERLELLRACDELTSFSLVLSATVLLWRNSWTRWLDGMRCCVRI